MVYMFLWKRRSCEYRHSRCLARITIALNRRSVFGQIQYTKPPEHLCLLKKLLQLVPVLVLTWSSYMIGDCNFDLSFPWCLHPVCLSLIHAGIHANKLLIKAHPIRNVRTPASTAMNKMGFLEQASLTLSPQPPLLFPFLPISYPFRRLLRRLGTKTLAGGSVKIIFLDLKMCVKSMLNKFCVFLFLRLDDRFYVLFPHDCWKNFFWFDWLINILKKLRMYKVIE